MKAMRALWWLVLAASLAILIGSLSGYYAVWTAAGLAAWMRLGTALGIVFSLVSAGLSLALACVLFRQKRDDTMGLFLSFWLLLYGVIMCGPLEHFLPNWLPPLPHLALQLQSALLVPSLVLILIFPNGCFSPRWTRILVAIAAITFLATLTFDYQETTRLNTFRAQAINGLMYGAILVALGVQVYRYRRLYTTLERQQMKWIAYGTLLSFVLFALDGIPYYYLQNLPSGDLPPWWAPLGGTVWFLSLSILPVSFTLAILRSRLWDIDVVIRKTTTYSVLTALLALIYFGSVVLLQRLFSTATGQTSPVALVLSTLLIAALFAPLRRRIQDGIDRRFYRRKYDAQKVLAAFARTARDEPDLDSLTAELVRVVQETLQPESVKVWLRPPESRQGFGKPPVLSEAPNVSKRRS